MNGRAIPMLRRKAELSIFSVAIYGCLYCRNSWISFSVFCACKLCFISNIALFFFRIGPDSLRFNWRSPPPSDCDKFNGDVDGTFYILKVRQ